MNGGSAPDLIDSFGEFALAWDFSSIPAVIFLVLLGAYLAGTTRLALRSNSDSTFWSKAAAGVIGFVLLAIALAGPFDFYSSEMFTMHMAQHIVIAMFAAPLILIARPLPATATPGHGA